MCWISKFFGTVDRPSPSDIVPENNIRHDVSANLILISLGRLNIPLVQPPKVWIVGVPTRDGKTATSFSMDPCFDFGNTNILIAGADTDDHHRMINFLKVGDIAIYQFYPDRYDEGYAIHRIAKIGMDGQGRYFKFKGDNNYAQDPYTIRDSMIKWVYIGTIC